MPEKAKITRRRFLREAAGIGGGLIAFPYFVRGQAFGKGGEEAASNRITVGCIGVGPQGHGVMRNFLAQKDARVVAVCDVKKPELEFARKRVNEHYGNEDCAVYGDFREVLGRDDIDVVLIATPDHWHVAIAIAAAKAGKDIYLEKPIGVTVEEAKALREVVRRSGTAFQLGTQQRSDEKFRLACELVRNGRIGELKKMNVWCPGSQGGGSTEVVGVPEWLDYEMWLGPAPYSPYTKDRCSNSLLRGNPFKIWPFISDYCVGWVSGWGIHPLDIAVWGAGCECVGLSEVRGKGVFPTDGGVCDTATNWWIEGVFENGIELNFTAEKPLAEWAERYKETTYHGTAFEGTEGWVHVSRDGLNTYPESVGRSVIRPEEIHLYESRNHARNLLDCVKSRSKTISNIEVSFGSDLICQQSAIALLLERKLVWDIKEENFVDDEAANRLLSRPMRSPWHL